MSSNDRKIAEKPHQIVERVAEFIKEGDLDGVVTMFHPECQVVMDPEGEPMVGHDGVRAIFADFVEQRMNLLGAVTGEMVIGDTGLLQGHWTVEDGEGNVVGGGTSTEVVKRADHGGWVYYIDCPVGVPAPGRS